MTFSDLHNRKCSRRDLAKGGIGLALVCAVSRTALAKAFEGYEPTSLTSRELAIVKALMARLIPADDTSGGAVEAGAHVYLDRALDGHQARYLDTYRRTLAELDRIAGAPQSGGVAALEAAQVDELIRQMEAGKLEPLVDGGSSFFNLLRRHTLEGYLSDPMYGGNQEFIGWRVIGYNGVQLVYSASAQQLNGRDEREARSVAAFGSSPIK